MKLREKIFPGMLITIENVNNLEDFIILLSDKRHHSITNSMLVVDIDDKILKILHPDDGIIHVCISDRDQKIFTMGYKSDANGKRIAEIATSDVNPSVIS